MHTITNNTDAVIYVGLNNGGSVAVMPGESRPFPISELAPAWRPEAEAAAPEAGPSLADEIRKLLKKPSNEIIEQIPSMESGLLTAIGEAEQTAKTPRKGLLSAIAEEQLTRADAEQKAAQNAAAGNNGAPA